MLVRFFLTSGYIIYNMEKKDIFSRFFSGMATEEDYETLVAIFESGDVTLFDEYCRGVWDESKVELSGEDKSRMKADIMEQLEAYERNVHSKKRMRFFKRTGVAAAVILVLFFIWSPMRFFRNDIQPEFFEIVVDRGQKSTLTLPDGSKVWVNSATTVSYSSDYNVNDRDVYLSGEAYFEVASGNELPFVVHAHDLQVTALGTRFNIKAYSEDNTVTTTLVEGKVSTEAGESSQVLYPYHEALYDKKSGCIKVSEVADRLHAIPWMKDEILFDNDSLEEIAVMLERMYNVNVVFSCEDVKAYSYTGLVRNNSLQNVLELISSTSPVGYRMTSDTIKFYVK